MDKDYFVYILGNERPTLYVGVTNDLSRRVYEHKEGIVEGFAKRYGLNRLLYYEQCSSVISAIEREKQLKHWNREWKLRLIKKKNPMFEDLYYTLVDPRLKSCGDDKKTSLCGNDKKRSSSSNWRFMSPSNDLVEGPVEDL